MITYEKNRLQRKVEQQNEIIDDLENENQHLKDTLKLKLK